MRNSLRRGALILSVGPIALAALTLPVQAAAGHEARPATGSLAARQARTTAGGWRLARTFSARGRDVTLTDIDAVGPADAWVVGAVQQGGSTLRALIGHWNGSAWSRAAVPPVLAAHFRGAVFDAIGASSSRNVWAFTTAGSYLRLAGNRWQFGRLPRRVRTRHDFVESTQVFSPTNVWVFGFRVIGSIDSLKFAPFVARFDGRSWRAVHVGGVGVISPVSPVSPASMWALSGAELPALGLGNEPRVVHWNGSAWRPVAVQPRLPRHATLTGILAESSRDVWVGGSVPNHQTGSSELALHWNGKSWTTASPPAPATSADEFLTSLVPDGSGGLWAVAEAIPGPARFWHYTGGAWAPPVAVRSDWLYPVLAAVPGSQSVWAIAASPGFTRGFILIHGALPNGGDRSVDGHGGPAGWLPPGRPRDLPPMPTSA